MTLQTKMTVLDQAGDQGWKRLFERASKSEAVVGAQDMLAKNGFAPRQPGRWNTKRATNFQRAKKREKSFSFRTTHRSAARPWYCKI